MRRMISVQLLVARGVVKPYLDKTLSRCLAVEEGEIESNGIYRRLR